MLIHAGMKFRNKEEVPACYTGMYRPISKTKRSAKQKVYLDI
jgi:hypothetical protein